MGQVTFTHMLFSIVHLATLMQAARLSVAFAASPGITLHGGWGGRKLSSASNRGVRRAKFAEKFRCMEVGLKTLRTAASLIVFLHEWKATAFYYFFLRSQPRQAFIGSMAATY